MSYLTTEPVPFSHFVLNLNGDACGIERAANPLYRARVNAKPSGYFADAIPSILAGLEGG